MRVACVHVWATGWRRTRAASADRPGSDLAEVVTIGVGPVVGQGDAGRLDAAVIRVYTVHRVALSGVDALAAGNGDVDSAVEPRGPGLVHGDELECRAGPSGPP